MSYSVIFEKQAEYAIQQTIDYYDRQQIGLGEKFWLCVKKHIASISNNPFFQIRYGEIRCPDLISVNHKNQRYQRSIIHFA